MNSILADITRLKLAQPKHRRAYFNWMARDGFLAYAEGTFVICAWDYIFNPDDQKGSAIPKVFMRPGSPLELNLGGTLRNTCTSMMGAHDITLKSFGSDKLTHTVTSFKKTTGLRAGGAANYNIFTQVLNKISSGMYREKLNMAIVATEKDGQLPNANPANWVKDEVANELAPYWGKDALKQLGVA